MIVGTVKKSMAAMASGWLRKNVCHRWAGSGALGARLIERETVTSDTSNPSICSHRGCAVHPKGDSPDHLENQLADLGGDSPVGEK